MTTTNRSEAFHAAHKAAREENPESYNLDPAVWNNAFAAAWQAGGELAPWLHTALEALAGAHTRAGGLWKDTPWFHGAAQALAAYEAVTPTPATPAQVDT